MEKENLLAAWLVEECNKRNLSWAEASRRAGVAANTISQVVNGTPAGPKRLAALAEYFDAPIEQIYQFAGLLPEPDDPDHDPLVQRYAEELLAIWRQLRDTNPDAARRLMSITIMQAEMVLAASRANCPPHPEPNPMREEDTITQPA